MNKDSKQYKAYVQILKQELIPATGCTEPIAIAFAAAKAREVLGCNPNRVEVHVSGSIVKNSKSVIIPNTDRQKGIYTAVAAGIVAGQSDKMLDVISEINEQDKARIQDCTVNCPIDINITDGKHLFEIIISAYAGQAYSKVHIIGAHTNIVLVEKDGMVLYENRYSGDEPATDIDFRLLNVKDIIDFADTVDIDDISALIDQLILYNTSISSEGLKHNYGANIGKTILATYGDNDVRVRAKAKAAAASDARMGGCDAPVIIVAGSGNQGITASIPVLEYAKELDSPNDLVYRALALSSLVTIHQKASIGKLSAFCGAVSAGVGSGAAIAYLHGGRYPEISHTIVNALAILSGMVCDGAKPSCAAKIAASVDAGIFGYEMYRNGQQFYSGDGLVAADVEATIANIGRLGKDGMRETDQEILRMMTE